MSDIVIKAEHLSKYYRLGAINHGMLYKDLQSWLARKLGKEDPHSQIGQDHFADRPEGFWALKDLNFEIKQGDRVGIIGKNGAGKSTLLKILSRITAPTEGQVKIKGRVTSLLEVGTGFHGELTGRENIYLNGAILGMKRSEISKKIDEIIDFSEISQFIDTPVKRYSSGMYVRLAFAVASHLNNDILIADEVLAVGDASFHNKAIKKMNDLSLKEGKTVLFVSHNMIAIRQLCSKGFILTKGRNSLILSISEIIDSYISGSRVINSLDAGVIERQKECTLRVKIYDFKIITKQGINTGIFSPDEEIVIEIYVESFFDKVSCGMQVFISYQGQNLIMLDSGHIKNKLFSINKGKYVFRCKLDKPMLFAGTYDVSIGISSPGTELFDFLPNVYSFELSHYDPANVGYNLHIQDGKAIFIPPHSYEVVSIN